MRPLAALWDLVEDRPTFTSDAFEGPCVLVSDEEWWTVLKMVDPFFRNDSEYLPPLVITIKGINLVRVSAVVITPK